MTKQDAINLLTQKDQLQLLSFYDTLTPQQQENLLAQIEGIDWSLLDVLKTHETVNARGTFAPLSAMELSRLTQTAHILKKLDYRQSARARLLPLYLQEVRVHVLVLISQRVCTISASQESFTFLSV